MFRGYRRHFVRRLLRCRLRGDPPVRRRQEPHAASAALWELYRAAASIRAASFGGRVRGGKAAASTHRCARSSAGRRGLTSWLEYCAEGLQQTLERVWQRIQKLSASSSRARVVLRPKQGSAAAPARAGKPEPARDRTAGAISKQGAMDLISPLVKAKPSSAWAR